VDSLDVGFPDENGSGLKECLAVVRTAVLTGVEDSGRTHSEPCNKRRMSVSRLVTVFLALHTCYGTDLSYLLERTYDSILVQ